MTQWGVCELACQELSVHPRTLRSMANQAMGFMAHGGTRAQSVRLVLVCEVVVECHGKNLIPGKGIRSRAIGRRSGRIWAGNLESSKFPVPEYDQGV